MAKGLESNEMWDIVNDWLKYAQGWFAEKCVFPSKCILCLQDSKNGKIVCEFCVRTLPWLSIACKRCALKMVATGICGKCLNQELVIERAQALFHYAWPINSFISRLKYQGNLHFAKLLGEWMAEYLTPDKAECILPMPLHSLRQSKRGFNQTIELAKPYAKYWQLPLCKEAAVREKSSVPQSSLSAKERSENIDAKDFVINPSFDAKHVLIIDDVMTTGATMRDFAKALKASGVQTVEALVVARA
jgi:ComF family protein